MPLPLQSPFWVLYTGNPCRLNTVISPHLWVSLTFTTSCFTLAMLYLCAYFTLITLLAGWWSIALWYSSQFHQFKSTYLCICVYMHHIFMHYTGIQTFGWNSIDFTFTFFIFTFFILLFHPFAGVIDAGERAYLWVQQVMTHQTLVSMCHFPLYPWKSRELFLRLQLMK